MSYPVQLTKAAAWLKEHQNADKGWGLAAGQGSSIVNTAEAIYVLNKACPHKNHAAICAGLEFIQEKTLDNARKNPKTRYVIFALLACLDHVDKVSPEFIREYADWLLNARNKDGAWGHTANDEQSRLYPTVMAILVLSKLRDIKDIEPGFHWIVSKKNTTGWRFSDDGQYSLVATAQAVIALRCFKAADDQLFSDAKDRLLTVSVWGLEAEDMPGTPWVHNSQMWIFWALTELGVDPYAKPIAQGVRELNKLNCEQGWREPSNHTTVRGQYWAVFAFETLVHAYDPALHTYRIDSALSGAEMREPDFVYITPHSKWSFVLPRAGYQAATYLLFLVSVGAFLGLHRLTQLVPRKSELAFAVLGFLATYWLVRKRKTLFPRWVMNIVIGIVALLSFIDLVFGYAVTNVFDYFTSVMQGFVR